MAPSLAFLIKMNKAGWLLYYSTRCGYCRQVKEKLGAVKWALLNKVDCTNKPCPPDVAEIGVPTWKNVRTLELWDGGGIFR
jgi:hypothetical protein